MAPEHNYWFRAKRYGYGWGLPLCWQGWVALCAYIALMVLDAATFRPHHQPLAFGLLALLLTLAFVAICWLKGEPAHWRWKK